MGIHGVIWENMENMENTENTDNMENMNKMENTNQMILMEPLEKMITCTRLEITTIILC